MVRPGATRAITDLVVGTLELKDGFCPHCGGELQYIETEGHELRDGDYYTPNSYIIDNYVYRCADCGEYIKTPNEL